MKQGKVSRFYPYSHADLREENEKKRGVIVVTVEIL